MRSSSRVAQAWVAVDDFLLRQGEEEGHRRVVVDGTDVAHGADEAVVGQGPIDLPRTEIAI